MNAIGWRSPLRDLLHLRALSHRYKALGRGLTAALHARRAPRDPSAHARVLASLAGRNLAVIIAFNTPGVIEWLLRFATRNLRDAAILIADNSSNEAAAAKIADVCAAHGVAYLRLPENPYARRRSRNFNMSHAVALNWTWRNVIRPLRPPVFAFLDHDLIALAPVRLADLVADQPVYGRRDDRPGGYWYLWPGYCVFRFEAVARRGLDFAIDGPNQLDVGGGNWWRLCRHLDPSRLRFAQVCWDGCERVDGFAHLGNASQYVPWDQTKRSAMDALLEREWTTLSGRT